MGVTTNMLAGIRRRIDMLIRRSELTSVDSTGTSTRIGLSANDFEEHEEVELFEPYGFTSVPPAASKVLLFCLGGDGGHPIALAAGRPQVRLSGLEGGDVAMYVGAGPGAGTGARVVLRADGDVEVQSGGATSGSIVLRANGDIEATPAVGRKVLIQPTGGVNRQPVARQTDPVALNAADITTINRFVTAWNATQPGGGPMLAIGGITLTPVTGTGTITAGGTGAEST